jgi:hypothetical protein
MDKVSREEKRLVAKKSYCIVQGKKNIYIAHRYSGKNMRSFP